MTIRSGIGLFLNRPQINTSAAYGFNPPLSEMATVINGNVDAPAGAQRRTFPLVMAMFSPDYANAQLVGVERHDRIASCRGRTPCSSPTSAAPHRTSSGRATSTSCSRARFRRIQASNANALRPYKGFGTITLYETTGRSRYNAMQLQVSRRAARGVGYSLAYTLSRTMDDGSSRLEILPNAYDDSGYYGISGLDRPHVLITQASYRTPALESAPAVLRGVLGDWNLGGVFQAQSGAPFDVTTTVDIAGVGPGSGGQYYNIVGDPNEGRTEFDGTRAVWFNRDAFQAPAAGHLRDHVGAQQPAAARLLGPAHVAAQERGGRHASSGVPVGRVQRAEPHEPGSGLREPDQLRTSGRSRRARATARCRSGCSTCSEDRSGRSIVRVVRIVRVRIVRRSRWTVRARCRIPSFNSCIPFVPALAGGAWMTSGMALPDA